MSFLGGKRLPASTSSLRAVQPTGSASEMTSRLAPELRRSSFDRLRAPDKNEASDWQASSES